MALSTKYPRKSSLGSTNEVEINGIERRSSHRFPSRGESMQFHHLRLDPQTSFKDILKLEEGAEALYHAILQERTKIEQNHCEDAPILELPEFQSSRNSLISIARNFLEGEQNPVEDLQLECTDLKIQLEKAKEQIQELEFKVQFREQKIIQMQNSKFKETSTKERLHFAEIRIANLVNQLHAVADDLSMPSHIVALNKAFDEANNELKEQITDLEQQLSGAESVNEQLQFALQSPGHFSTRNPFLKIQAMEHQIKELNSYIAEEIESQKSADVIVAQSLKIGYMTAMQEAYEEIINSAK